MNAKADDSVVELRAALRRAQGVALIGHAVECSIVAAGAFLAVLAVCRLEGASAAPAILASALAAACAGGAAWCEGRPTSDAVTARLDARLGFEGALITFDEHGARSSFGPLLARRACAEGTVQPRRALRVRAALFVAAGLCAALCAWAHERTPPVAPLSASIERAAAALAGAARRSSTAVASAPDSSVRELASEVGRLAELAREDPARAERGASALAERIASVEAALPTDDAIRAALAEARRALGGAELAMRPRESPMEGRSAGTSVNATASGASGGAGVVPSDAPTGSPGGAPTLPTAAMSATDASSPPAFAPALDASGSESGLAVTGSWWDPRYDAVVSHWIEARRVRR